MPTESNPPPTVDALLRVVAERDAEVAQLRLLVDKLKAQLLRRAREQFGASSEQLAAQLPLIGAEAEVAPLASVVPLQRRAPRKPRSNERKLPEHLPRETRVLQPAGLAAGACACGECGGKLRTLGQDVSEQLEHVPASFKVIRHVRPKLACVRCQRIFQADAPSRAIQRGLPGPGLLAQVLVAKYCDHTPLYRQSRIYAREGVDIARSTMVDWVAQSAALLDPLVAALGRYALSAAKLHSDDTPVKVLDPGRGKTKTARLWVYVRDDRPSGSADPPAAWYRYSADRKGERPRSHLAQYRGILQADGYAGYAKLYAHGSIVEAACWAHARRHFWDVYDSQKRIPGSLAEQALQRIAKLYEIEADIRGHTAHERRRLHGEKTRLLEFGRHAAERRRRRGLGKPATFTFLGFTFICGKTRRGSFQLQRKTRRDRMRAKLKHVKEQLRRRMHDTIPAQGRWLKAVVTGYFAYHAVPTNFRALQAFHHHVTDLWLRTLARRSQKAGLTWERMAKLAAAWLPTPHILHPWPERRFAVNHPR